MTRTLSDVENDIGRLTGSYTRGYCLKCKKAIAKGSQKVVNSYDICWSCYKPNASPNEDRLMSLINEWERREARGENINE